MNTKNLRLLSFCPTKNRPDKLKDLLESFDRTKSDGTDIFVYVAHNNMENEYKKVLEGRHYMIGDKERCLVEIVNYVTCELFPNIPYYQCLNDDHYIHTKEFDNILIDKIETEGKGWGTAFGRSLVNEKNWELFRHPSAEITSGNIPRTLGYYCTPLLQHYNADYFHRDIGEGINRIFRVMEVIIEHRHWVAGTAKMDENYKQQYNKENIIIGDRNYNEWVNKHKSRDINKILQAMKNK
jgi:hypothetical protein